MLSNLSLPTPSSCVSLLTPLYTLMYRLGHISVHHRHLQHPYWALTLRVKMPPGMGCSSWCLFCNTLCPATLRHGCPFSSRFLFPNHAALLPAWTLTACSRLAPWHLLNTILPHSESDAPSRAAPTFGGSLPHSTSVLTSHARPPLC